MPKPLDFSERNMPMSLKRRENRASRAMTIISLRHIPDTLSRLDEQEKRLMEEFRTAFTVKDLCSITSALDTIRERRRILLGIPLPGSRSGKETRIHRTLADASPARMVDVIPIPDSDARELKSTAAKDES